MLIDGRTLGNGAEITTTVCIVGSGPAGLTLAIELLRAGTGFTVIESGDTAIDPWTQSLNDGPNVGDPYAGLRNTRQRQLGGTIQAWNTPVGEDVGAKYAPLDPNDLRTDEAGGEPSGWPIGYEELEPFYRRAQAICGLGEFDYSAGPLLVTGRLPFELSRSPLVSKVYQFGRADRFLGTHLRALLDAESVVYTNLTVVSPLVISRSTLKRIRAVTRSGADVTIRADVFILAAGAVENARLLLLFQEAAPDFITDSGGWLGRCFMEHPRDNALVLVPTSPQVFERARFYDVYERADGSAFCGRLAFAHGAPASSGLPNMSVTLLPRAKESQSWIERVMAHRRPRTSGGYGWSSLEHPEKRFDAFRLLINTEQRPRPANRIILSDERDALGQRRPELQWRLSPDELRCVRHLRTLVAAELEAAGIGHVDVDHSRLPDPNAHHHAGTTRMAADPSQGVVDKNCRVFATDNLYVAGASVFPTAGFANPSLTIAAMACRVCQGLLGSDMRTVRLGDTT